MSTINTYRQISNDLARWRSITSSKPEVKLASTYFQENIGKAKTTSDLINNPRLFNYAMKAFGLGDRTYAKGLMSKVLEQGAANGSALANTLNNPNILAFAKAFDFAAKGSQTTASNDLVASVVNRYTESALEEDQGKVSPGVELALYFERRAPALTSVYGILADKKLLQVVQTTLGISPLMAAQKIDRQHALLSKQVKIEDFQDPQKLRKFIERFSAMYDSNAMDPLSASYSSSNAPNALLLGGAGSGGGGVIGIDPGLLLQAQRRRG